MPLTTSTEPTASRNIPAATVIVFRHDPAGGAPQLMMLERGAHMRFAAGASVFPGGRIDPHDRALAASLTSDLPADDTAARIAAIRETLEETGLLLGVSESVSAETAASARALLFELGALGPVLDRFGLSLDLDQLVPFARWCPHWERAFDTHFYLADLGTGAVAVAEDGTETARLYWSSAAATLALIEAGAVSAIFPTVCNLQRLAGFATFADACEQARAFPPRLIQPWKETVDGTDYLCIPADAGYPAERHPLDRIMRG